MNWNAFFVTLLLFYFPQIIASYFEGTLLRSQGKVQMTFWWNLAVSMGIPIFAVISGLVINASTLSKNYWITYLLAALLGYFSTSSLYWLWWKEGEGNRGHILFKDQPRGVNWIKSTSIAGWINYVGMIYFFAVICLFLIAEVPADVAIRVPVLLATFFTIQNWQAEHIQGGYKKELAYAEYTALIVIAIVKLFLF